jgi:ribosome-binding protein aMBF1 (putative translation factor)
MRLEISGVDSQAPLTFRQPHCPILPDQHKKIPVKVANTIVCGRIIPRLRFLSLPFSLSVKFGRVLKSFRQAAGLSQEELAHRSNLHRTYVSQLERGLKSPSLNAIAALAKGLKMTAHELVKAAEEKGN